MSAIAMELTAQLTPEQVAFYRKHGYIAVENALSPDEIAELQRVTDMLVEQSRQHMVRYFGSNEKLGYIASHIAVSTPLSLDEIYAIAKRENWRAAYSSRREKFRLVEFWMENRILVELILPQDLADAKAALKVDAFNSDHKRLGYDLSSGKIVDAAE